MAAEHERRNLNNPVVVSRKWTAATRVKKSKPPAGFQARGATSLQHEQELVERVGELEQELAAARSADLRDLLRRVLDEVGDHIPVALRAQIEDALKSG